MAIDFDGTLAPIVADPDRVRVPPPTRALLARSARLPSVRVAVVSARPMRDLREHLPGRGLLRAAQYSLEGLAAPPARRRRTIRRDARALRALLEPIVARFPGAWIEDKGLTLGVHYRGLRQTRSAALLRALEPARREAKRLGFTAEGGRRVIDFVPSGYDKGRALQALIRRTRPAATFYFGDSAGDESAFAVLGRKDYPVRVGAGTTGAAYRVREHRDVARFLRALVACRVGRTGLKEVTG